MEQRRLAGGVKFWEGRGLVILFFLLLFLYGCLVFQDYGIGVDEPVERKSSLITWLHLNPSLKDVVTDTVDFTQLQPLEEYQDRYYGVTVMLPCVLAEHLTGFTMPLSQVYAMRHFYTFALFWIGTVFFYLLCREFVKQRWMALAGAAFLVFSPRILADSFYNLKDLIFLSLMTVALYFGIRFLKKPALWNLLGLSVVSALCINVRIIGGYVLAVCLAAAFFKSLWAYKKGAADARPGRTALFCLGAGVLSLACYLLFTPITWDNPAGRLMEIIRHFSDYSVWNDYNYYMGQYLTREEIPWHYLFVWMGITIPVVTLACALGGIAAAFLDGFSWERLCIVLMPVVPLAYVVWFRPTLYNGWRHFYFLFPFWCLFALFFVDFCHRRLLGGGKKKALYGFWAVICAGFLMTAVWIGRNHPYDYVYFNEAARNWALPRFDRDYWGVSEKDALNYICAHDDSEEIKIFLLTDFSLPLLSEENQKRIVRVGAMEEATYYVHGYHAGALGGLLDGCEGMDAWYSFEVDGYPIRTIYKR